MVIHRRQKPPTRGNKTRRQHDGPRPFPQSGKGVLGLIAHCAEVTDEVGGVNCGLLIAENIIKYKILVDIYHNFL